MERNMQIFRKNMWNSLLTITWITGHSSLGILINLNSCVYSYNEALRNDRGERRNFTSKAGIEFVINNEGSTLLMSRGRRPE